MFALISSALSDLVDTALSLWSVVEKIGRCRECLDEEELEEMCVLITSRFRLSAQERLQAQSAARIYFQAGETFAHTFARHGFF